MATTTYVWTELRQRATTLFNGDTPGPAIETNILHHFTQNPAHLADLIEAIGRRVATGNVKSGWAILNAELARVVPDLQATDNRDRAQQLRYAEQWIRNTGGYIDREPELLDTLYGETAYTDKGHTLRHWPDTQQQIVALWHEQRHRFQRIEEEAETRARAATQLRERIRATMHANSPIDLDAQAERIANDIQRAHDAYLDTIAPDTDPEL